ncbi:MAG: chromosomal replication initiator protein DnaA [Candidatus Sungbacteria bacterium]|nr:chromosomal replication initiator protein DnaA [Candidatus Sungbacteria bacterium]
MDYRELWKAALGEIELAIPRPSFITWFKETAVFEISDGIVTISVPNGFAKEWLQSKYNKFIIRALRNVADDSVRDVAFVVGRASVDGTGVKTKERQKVRLIPTVSDEMQLKDLHIDPETGLNPRYTFENFIVGSFNELAHGAARAVVQNLGSAYNPLFIFGGVGLGKTHLIQAIGNEIAGSHGAKVRYVTSEKYMGEIVEALSNQTINQLKERYRKVDLLIMDDIQFIARTEKMQEEFFHTFNVLYQQNKQIVISSDRPPSAIPTLENRLRSRFEGGCLIDVGEPDLETRLTILKAKAGEKGIALPEDVFLHIASVIKNNIRELEGALTRLALSARTSSATPTLEETKKILEQVAQAPKKFTSPKKVIKVVADFYEIMEKDLVNPSRRKEIVKPRQIAMYILREELKCSYPFIGEKLGKKDHTTAIHACKKIDGELKTDLDLQNSIKLIKEKIYSV